MDCICIGLVLLLAGVHRLPIILGLPTSFEIVRGGKLATFPR